MSRAVNSVTIAAIVAMNEDRVIGRVDGGMPWHYSEDLKRFRRLTLNTCVIMGRHTFESIGGKPLPKRRNIVLSRRVVSPSDRQTFGDNEADTTSLVFVTSLDAAINAAVTRGEDRIWIIGGGQLYDQALDRCDLIDVTYVPDKVYGDDLVYFPRLDDRQWHGSALTCPATDSRLRIRQFERRDERNESK